MYGFPFIYKAPATFYASMAEEYFILGVNCNNNFIFGVIFGMVYLINKFFVYILIKKN
jgi:hypothetical protein